MSWLFSQALVEACSPLNSSAIEPCAQLNVMPSPQPFWRNDKTMEPSRFSRFGLTFAPLTEDRGAALLTAWQAGFRVRTSALPAPARALTAHAPDSGASSRASFARWSPESFGWRTAQCSLLEDSPEFLATLPRWGSMRSGMLYLRQTLVPGISVSGFGSLLPTLTVCGNYNAKGASPTSGDSLATALKRLPTLVARDYRHPGRSRLERTGSKAGEHLPNTVGGPLNPDWCEWFMGFPIGWTASDALAMPKFQEWRRQHSPRLQPNLSEVA
jgi:hypothetical protein